MTAAEKAYQAAEAEIARVQAAGETELDLSRGNFSALEVLPPEIAKLSQLEMLDLNNTQIGNAGLALLFGMQGLGRLWLGDTQIDDAGLAHLSGLQGLGMLYLYNTQISDTGLTHLSGLQGLRMLILDNTQVNDLRPLLDFASEWQDEKERSLKHLYFRNIPALANDAKLRELSEVMDTEERTTQTLAYLQELVARESQAPKDTPRGAVYAMPDDGPVHSQDEPPTGGDVDQAALQDDLKSKAMLLLAMIGGSNELGVLRGQVEHYQTRLTAREIRIKLLWSAYNSLRQAYEADDRAEQSYRSNDLLPPKICAALKDLVETHALFAMGFENAAALERQMREGVDGLRNPELLRAAGDVVSALADRTDAVAQADIEALQDDVTAAGGAGASAEMAEDDLNNRLWNMFGAVGRKAWTWVKGGAATGGSLLLAHDFIEFLLGNETIVMNYLRLAQGPAANWFSALMQAIRGVLGA